ncbi:DNA-binding GntR family transcriptional regulator [Azospirillum lipoferum]|uniref:GntR family transcriptional regulator n=1 Tax=Azospirillum lipoferum TaxID=193 RepID=A0A5A9GL52_AZOLI|nr:MULTISPECIES: GntR family transcriptional regulator [Azospirillum]KAA0595156.1 GntR family transcriptional regulator [Azospirillum lipoferum]MCP1611977.1 DNA-binding GntR family transcriptional regulator [Azospirillum lipoferum]MDW5533264.1 GntR family transcriptional regulator [Azospirillum sp. NL1]
MTTSAKSDGAKRDRETVNLRSRAYESFTQRLLADEIRPGQFISQRELVELTELPLGAIRELIPRLEAEGLVKTVPQRGMQVAHVDLNLIRDAFQFRLFLEREAVAVFAQEAPEATIGALLDDHERIIAACAEAESKGGVQPVLLKEAQDIDWALHLTIIDALGNAIISDAYRVNQIKIRLIKQAKTKLNTTVLVPTMREHLAIIHAIQARDPDRAKAAIGTHILSARDRAIGLR